MTWEVWLPKEVNYTTADMQKNCDMAFQHVALGAVVQTFTTETSMSFANVYPGSLSSLKYS